MKKRNGLIKTSLACALIFGGVGLLAGCGKEDPKVTINDIYVTGDYADSVKEYVIGSEVSLAGATVEVSFSDGTKQTVTITDEMWKKADYDFTTIGEKTITVKFKVNGEEKSETITIKIVNPLSVQEIIDEIRNFTINPFYDRWMEETVDTIKASYNELSDTDKALVTNYSDFFTAYKSVKQDVISNYVEVEDYEEDDRTTITGYIETATTAISNATTMADVDAAVTSAKTSINAIETTLDIRKAVVLEAFDTYVEENFDEEDYSTLKWSALQLAIQTAREEIENATDINFLPDVTNGYFNSNFTEIDTLVTENFKTEIENLPEVSEIVTFDAQLMSEVQELLNAYENNLTYEEQYKISTELIEKLEAVEFKLGTLDLNAFKEEKINVINELLNKENEYEAEDWQNILEDINNAINNINNVTYNKYAKTNINSAYSNLMDRIYGNYATIEVLELYESIGSKLPKWYESANSNKVVFTQDYYELYNVYDNKFFVDSIEYTISGETITDGSNTYDIIDGKFVINDEEYTLIEDLQASVASVRTLYNVLSQEEKGHYKAIEVRQLLEKYETIVADKADYLIEKLELLEEYLNEDTYNQSSLDEISSIIEAFKHTKLSAYTLEQYKETLDYYYNSSLQNIGYVSNKLDDIKTVMNNELKIGGYYSYNDYYEDELTQIDEIAENAKGSGEAIELENYNSMAEAVNAVQTIIDNAKASIDAVKKYQVVNEDKINEYLATLETTIESMIYQGGYPDFVVEDKTIKEMLNDTTCEYALCVGYRNAKAALLDEEVLDIKDSTFNELLRKYEIEKIKNIDHIGRLYVKSFGYSSLREKLAEYIANPTEDNMYVNLGPIRESLKGVGYGYSSEYLYHFSNYPDHSYNKVYINGVLNDYGEHYKVENGYLFASITTLSFITDSTMEIKIDFGRGETLKDTNNNIIYDTYRINFSNITSTTGNVSSIEANADSIGKESELDTNVGYVSEEEKLYTYKNGATLEIVYKDGESDISGPAVIKAQFSDGYYTRDTIFYIYDANANKTMSLPVSFEEDVNRYATDHGRFIKKILLSVSSSAGIDNELASFSLYTVPNVDKLKVQYKADIDAYFDANNYTPEELAQIEIMKTAYKAKIDKVKSHYQFDSIWESTGVIGTIDGDNLSLSGNTSEAYSNWYSYSIVGNELYWKGVKAGSIEAGNITINETTWSLEKYTDDKGYDGFKILANGVATGYYTIINESSKTVLLQYFDDQGGLWTVEEYTIDENNNLLYTDYGSNIPGIIGSIEIVKEGEEGAEVITAATKITINAKNYIVDGTNVIDEYEMGFTNMAERDYAKEVEFVAPTIVVNDQTLIEKTDDYNNKYYEYNMTKEDSEVLVSLTGFDSENFYAKYNDNSISFPYILGSNVMYIDYYRLSDDSLVGRQEIRVVQYTPITSLKINGVQYDKTYNGFYIELDRMLATNTLEVEVEEGYKYYISGDSNNTVDLNNLYLEIGRNYFGILVRLENEDASEMHMEFLEINVASDLTEITFGGAPMSNADGVYDVYDNEAATELTVAYEGEETDIDAIDVVDSRGNSILNSNGKVDVTNIPVLRARLKVTIDSVVYYKDITLINENVGQGNEYPDEIDWDTGDITNYGLESSIEFKYVVNNDTSIKIECDNDSDYRIWIWDTNEQQVQFRYGTIIAPKGFNIDNIIVEKGSVYTGEATIELSKVSSVSNILKLTIKVDGEVDGVVYFFVEEGEDSIDNNCEIYGGEISIMEYYQLYGSVTTMEEMLTAIKGHSATVTEDTTITSESDYYEEGINKYYRANLTVDVGDFFFTLTKNKFQNISMMYGDVLEYDDDFESYAFASGFKTGDVIIVDVVSADKTSKFRYIYTLTKVDAMLGVEVVIDNDTKINLELRNNGFAGDFMDVGDEEIIMAAFAGEQSFNVGDTVIVNFSASEEALQNGVLTLDGNYDPVNADSYLDASELKNVSLTVQAIQVELNTYVNGIVFCSHTIDPNTKAELQKIQLVVLFTDGMNG